LSWLTGAFLFTARCSVSGSFVLGGWPDYFLLLVCAASGVALYRLMPKPAEWRAS